MKKQSTFGAILVALSALGFATNPILAKIAYQGGATPTTLLAVRFITAAVGLWSWLLLLYRAPAGVPGLTAFRRVQLLALGAVGFATVSLLYFTALPRMDASLATGIFYTYPAMVALVELLRGVRLGRVAWIGLAATAVGTWLLLGIDFSGFTWSGTAFILAAAAVYTAYILVSNHWSRGIPPVVVSAHVTAGAAALYLVLAVMTRQGLPGSVGIAAGVGLAFCSTILALVTFFAGLSRIGATRAAIISNLEPAMTSVLAVLLLDEHVSLMQAAGITLVVLGAIFAHLGDWQRAQRVDSTAA